MDKKRLEELYTRALDGCLTREDEREYAAYLKEHPEVLEELEGYRRVRASLRAEVPASVEPPYPEFFNSHLERMVRESGEKSSGVEEKKGWLGGWGAWLVPASAAAVLAFFAGMQIGPTTPPQTTLANGMVPAVYSPIASVNVEAVVDPGIGGTIITLEGLEDLPDSVELLQADAGQSEARVYVASSSVTF